MRRSISNIIDSEDAAAVVVVPSSFFFFLLLLLYILFLSSSSILRNISGFIDLTRIIKRRTFLFSLYVITGLFSLSGKR